MFDILVGQRLVAVPVAHPLAAGLVGAVEELHEAHAFLDQPPREDAVPRVGRLGLLDRTSRLVGTVAFEHMRGLAGNVRHLRHRKLHPRGELVAGDARSEFGVAREFLEVTTIQERDELARRPVGLRGKDRRPPKVAQRLRRVEIGALECGR